MKRNAEKRLETFAEAWAAIPRPICPLCDVNKAVGVKTTSRNQDPHFDCLDNEQKFMRNVTEWRELEERPARYGGFPGCTLTITSMSKPYWTLDCKCYECGHEWVAPLDAELGKRVFAARERGE